MDVFIVAAVTVAFALFLRLAFDVFAIRKMMEAQGGDSAVRCSHCRFPIPAEASACGHCGREVTRVDAP
jgi:hypothetical protein